jgi:hypothetical protein
MRTSVKVPSFWDEQIKRRKEFCARFINAHHPGMDHESRPLVPLHDGPRRINNIASESWWLQTNDSVSALGFVYLGYLFDHHKLLDHAWMIGRDEQEPWALVSEPYAPPATSDKVEALRNELDGLGTDLLEYPSEHILTPGETPEEFGGLLFESRKGKM